MYNLDKLYLKAVIRKKDEEGEGEEGRKAGKEEEEEEGRLASVQNHHQPSRKAKMKKLIIGSAEDVGKQRFYHSGGSTTYHNHFGNKLNRNTCVCSLKRVSSDDRRSNM